MGGVYATEPVLLDNSKAIGSVAGESVQLATSHERAAARFGERVGLTCTRHNYVLPREHVLDRWSTAQI